MTNTSITILTNNNTSYTTTVAIGNQYNSIKNTNSYI